MTEHPIKKKGLPHWARPEVIRKRDEEKLAPYRSMTLAQRAEILAAACRLAMQQVMCHPDPSSILRFTTPVSEETKKLWQRLRAGYHFRDDHS